MSSERPTITPANSYTYGFDNLDRLTSAVKTGTTRGWTHDANGNRLTETGASPSTYTISSANNRVSSVSGAVSRTYTYNAAGNTLTYSNITATYNNRGRMKTLKKGSTTATFTYNALGELVKRVGGTPGTVHYVYDEAGHLLGEYNSTGALVQETIWLGDTPVATLRPGTPVGIFYVHTDHLNTPRKVTRPSDNKARWTWESDPFGTALPNENPQSLGNFKYNLRFPGQLYDTHTGLMYNYFRDYDAVTGRYVQSDPIGLAGGINTYGYVAGNPLRYSDPRGLNPGVGCIAGAWAGPIGCGVGAVIGTVLGGVALAAIMSTPGDTPKDDGKVVPLFPGSKAKEAEQCYPDDIDPCEELLAALQVRYVQLMSRAAQGIDVTFEVRQYMAALREFTILCPGLSGRAPKLPPELRR